MTTLLVSGGRLVDELSVRPMDLLIQDGRLQAIMHPGHGRTADQVLDARGLHVLPLLRGTVAWRNSAVCVEPGFGQLVPA